MNQILKKKILGNNFFDISSLNTARGPSVRWQQPVKTTVLILKNESVIRISDVSDAYLPKTRDYSCFGSDRVMSFFFIFVKCFGIFLNDFFPH